MRYTKAALKIYIKNYFISFPKIDLPNVKFKSCENNTFILNISCVCVHLKRNKIVVALRLPIRPGC